VCSMSSMGVGWLHAKTSSNPTRRFMAFPFQWSRSVDARELSALVLARPNMPHAVQANVVFAFFWVLAVQAQRSRKQ
jgi:hypothetical protein